MDKSQETKFTALIEGVATATGQTFFYDEILALLKESSELSQKLSQIYDDQDEASQSLGQEYSNQKVEVSLRRNEAKLRKEIKEIVDDLTSLKNIAELQQRRLEHRIKTEEPTVEDIEKIISEKMAISFSSEPTKLTTTHEFTPNELAKIDELTKLPPEELINEMDAVLASSNAHFDKADHVIGKALADQIGAIITLYQFRIAYVDLMILTLRKLFNKYMFERHLLRIKRVAIRAFLVVAILGVGVAYLISFSPWLLISLLLTLIAECLNEFFIQPYLEKHLFTPSKRKDLKILLSQFYDESILARCYLALAKHYLQIQLFKDDPSLGKQNEASSPHLNG